MIHLIHSSVLALLLYLIYRWIIKGSQGFQTHRFYLLALPLIAGILPLLIIPIDLGISSTELLPAAEGAMMQPIAAANEITSGTIAEAKPVNIEWIIFLIYSIGAGGSLLLFLYKLAQIQQWKDDGKTAYENGIYITRVPNLASAFSFLNHIFINDAFAKAEYHQILAHEKVHVSQKHSWDLLFYELLRIVFWFHPVSYLAQNDLKLVHEFIADEKTIALHGKKSYYQNLLKQVMDCPDFSFANPFFKSKTIKSRLTMIQKSQNQKFPFRKLLWMLPVLFASLTYTACTTEPEQDSESEKMEKITSENMKEFYDGGKFSDVTAEEYELIRKIKQTNIFVNFKSDNPTTIRESDFNLLENARRNYNNLIKKSVKDVTIDKSVKGQMTININYDDQKLYDAILATRFMTELDDSKLEDIIADYETPEIVQDAIERGNAPNTMSTNDVEIVEQNADVPFAIIENVPTYPGCSGTNQEKKECMQEKITQFVNKNFNTGLANDLSLQGKQTISVQFMIDKNGEVIDVQTRAKAPELQTEAARVINMLPKMKPGIQQGKEVNVIYGLPIIFEVK